MIIFSTASAMSRMLRSSQNAGRVDVLAGSERMLRVHHKNAVFSRNLQHSIEKLDVSCKKTLRRVQQTIFDVYFNEFVPIREEARALKLPKLTSTAVAGAPADERIQVPKVFKIIRNTHPKRQHGGDIHMGLSHNDLPNISTGYQTRSLQSSMSCSDHEENLNKYSMKAILKLPEIQRQRVGALWRRDLDQAYPCDSDSDTEVTQSRDEADLQRIRNAIALTSQPSKSSRIYMKDRICKSFLLKLRRTSKDVWHSEMMQLMQRAIDGIEKKENCHSSRLLPLETSLWDADLAKMQTSFSSNLSDEPAMLEKGVACGYINDGLPRDGRGYPDLLSVEKLKSRFSRTFASDFWSDDDTVCPVSEISEEPSCFRDYGDFNCGCYSTSTYSSYDSDSYDWESSVN